MQMVRLSYKISADVTLTGSDLALLWDCSQSHYDWKCKSLSERGWLTRQVNMFIQMNQGNNEKGIEFCRENPDKILEASVDTDRLNTLMKVLGISEGMKAVALHYEIGRLLETLNKEYLRLNPPEVSHAG